ncbi:MAG TPA: response regulator [Nitrospira sp.]|nr:response regulator [Nitrospira sp.]
MLVPMKPTVLVVDDEAAVVSLCKRILEQEGFSTLTAGGSSEALKICKHHPGSIEVLLTDLVLPPPDFSLASGNNEFPHVHGHELAIRALRMRDQLRIVLMSGNIDKELAGYGIQKGSLPFLGKPFETATMISFIRDALSSPPPTLEAFRNQPGTRPAGSDEWFD